MFIFSIINITIFTLKSLTYLTNTFMFSVILYVYEHTRYSTYSILHKISGLLRIPYIFLTFLSLHCEYRRNTKEQQQQNILSTLFPL